MKQTFIQKQIDIFMDKASLIHDKYVKDNQVPTDTAIIYHYTDYNGLSGIIQNQNIWFTDYRYLNDPSEVAHTIGIINNMIDRHILKSKYKSLWKDFKRSIEYRFNDPNSLRIFISSYCSRSDCLPAWRFYANNGTGFALGITIKVENEIISDNDRVITKINYKENDAETMILDFFELSDKRLQKVLGELKFKKDQKHFFDQFVAALTSQLISLLPTFKHKEYVAEEEIRQYIEIIPQTNIKFEKELFYRNNKISNNIPFVKHRNTKIPTLKRAFEKEQLSEIWVGPCCEFLEAKIEITKLLTVNGYDIKKVKIYTSEIPYRH